MCGGLAFFWLRLYTSNNNSSWTTYLGIKGRNLHLLTVLSHLNKFVMLQLLPRLFLNFSLPAQSLKEYVGQCAEALFLAVYIHLTQKR